MNNRYLSAQEASDALGVSVQTLYSYVSRGLIRSEADDNSLRTRRYNAEDVQRLIERKEGRRNPEKLTENALHWGAPLMESAITLIADGTFYYRGYPAPDLAQTHTLEQVAALLWFDDLDAGSPFDARAVTLPEAYAAVKVLPPMLRLSVVLSLAAADDIAAYDLRPVAVARTGGRILRLMTAALAGTDDPALSIAALLARGWSPDTPGAASLLNTALVLCADHELNVSSFTARCVASAGSTPYAVVSAGLAAMQGTKHGGYTERVEAFLQEMTGAGGVRGAMAGRLKRGEKLPGFGHPLYPDGDPRTRVLLDGIAAMVDDDALLDFTVEVVETANDIIGEYPTVDFALAVLARALRLPEGGSLALFALGRTVGWVGHALEQYEMDRMIRPRARYTGRQPGHSDS